CVLLVRTHGRQLVARAVAAEVAEGMLEVAHERTVHLLRAPPLQGLENPYEKRLDARERARERACRLVRYDAAPAPRGDLKGREIDEARQAWVGPRRAIEPEGGQLVEAFRDERARGVDLQSMRLGAVLRGLAREIDL